MTQRIVTDETLEKALDWLRDSAKDVGDAKGEAVRTNNMIKVTKALEMKKHNNLSAAKAEVEALASEAYLKALDEDAKATSHYEYMKALREAAVQMIDVWRSEQANFRGMKI